MKQKPRSPRLGENLKSRLLLPEFEFSKTAM